VPIPPVIHRYWDGSRRPSYVDKFGTELVEFNPNWLVKTWSSSTICQEPDLQELLESTTDHVRPRDKVRHEANLIRYWLLLTYGGVWVDCDVRPLRSFASLTASDHPIFASLGTSIEGALIGAPTGHPVFRSLLEAAREDRRTGESSVQLSGAGLLTRVVPHFRDVLVLPPRAVFETDAQGKRVEGEPVPDPLARHMWASSSLTAASGALVTA
jgi:mannosyltransferase OCH1-like enzyme